MSLAEPQATAIRSEGSEDVAAGFQIVASLTDAIGSNASVVVFGSDRTVHPDDMTDGFRAEFAKGLLAAAHRTLDAARHRE